MTMTSAHVGFYAIENRQTGLPYFWLVYDVQEILLKGSTTPSRSQNLKVINFVATTMWWRNIVKQNNVSLV